MTKIKFEDKMQNLEKLINELENNETPLEESINKYTEAMKLYSFLLNKKLYYNHYC